MKHLLSLALAMAASGAQAHVADVSPVQHATEHGWLALLLVPLALLLPLVRSRRR